jgi:hypothetical protein
VSNLMLRLQNRHLTNLQFHYDSNQ